MVGKIGPSVMPRSRRYEDVTATYIYAGRKYSHVYTLSISTGNYVQYT